MKRYLLCLLAFTISFTVYSQTDEEITIDRLFYTAGISVAPNPGIRLEENGNSLRTDDFGNKTIITGLEVNINYHLIKNYFSVGAGTMLTRTYTPNYNQLWFYADFRGYLSDEINTIYLFLRLGKSIPLGEILLNGQSASLGAGFRFKVIDHVFLADISIQRRTAQFDQKEWYPSNHKANTGGTYFGLSYMF